LNIGEVFDTGKLKRAVTWRFRDKYLSYFDRAQLYNPDFSIISNSCLGGSIYHKYGLQYTSPTIGTFFYSDEYLRMLENLKHYMAQPLVLKETSMHQEVNQLMANTHKFPVGLLGGDVEIMFLHYSSLEEARAKWNRRVKRINFDNLFIIFTDAGAAGGGAGGDDFRDEYIDRFEALPFKNKILFSALPRRGQHTVHIKDNDPRYPWVENMVFNRKYEKYIDVTAWLNYESFVNKKIE
jgi:uncharacterized protein (DUF1919 family)